MWLIYENLGLLVKRDIIDKSLFLDIYAFIIAHAWNDLEGWVAIVRSMTGNQSLYVNFEYIASVSHDELASQHDTYPPQVKRLNPRMPKAAAKLLNG